MTHIPKFLCMVFLLFFMSCDFLDHTKKYKQINSAVALDITVNSVESANGLILNNEYYCGGVYFLFENNPPPSWLFEKDKMIDLPMINDAGELIFGIWDIRPPYQLYKNKNSNLMLIVKEGDTLKTILP